jgi:hypothetical protein
MSALPSIITPALLSTIRTYPHLPHHAAHAWYLIAATTLAVLNRPDEITTVYRYAISHGPGAVDCKLAHEEQLKNGACEKLW